MNIQCPICDSHHELERSDLPKDSSDDAEWECSVCYSTMQIGWYAVAEVRKNVVSAPLNENGDWTGEPVAVEAANTTALSSVMNQDSKNNSSNALIDFSRQMMMLAGIGLVGSLSCAILTDALGVDMPAFIVSITQEHGSMIIKTLASLAFAGAVLHAIGLMKAMP